MHLRRLGHGGPDDLKGVIQSPADREWCHQFERQMQESASQAGNGMDSRNGGGGVQVVRDPVSLIVLNEMIFFLEKCSNVI